MTKGIERGLCEEVRAAAEARGLSNIRVFGSVARGDDHAKSDIDLLVHPADDSSVFDLAGFMAEASKLLAGQSMSYPIAALG